MPQDNKRVFIENGILYNNYTDKLDLGEVLMMAKENVALLDSKKISKIPVIVNIGKGVSSKAKLKLSDFSEIFHIGVVSKLSSIWVIGAEGGFKDLLKTVGATFFNGKLFFIDSVEAAESELKAAENLGI